MTKTNHINLGRVIQAAKRRLPIFRAAAAKYQWPEEVDNLLAIDLGPDWMAWVLMGICSRESQFGLLLDQEGKGDNGHGHGEMQIDDRSHGRFCASGKWRTLADSLDYVHRAVIVPAFNYLGERFDLFDENYERLFWATVAAYNCGPGNVFRALQTGQDPDVRTTGRDYSQDVRRRAREVRDALEDN
jgi:hypothetical protein